jgi:hypothetical protein
LKEFLGLKFVIEVYDRDVIEITYAHNGTVEFLNKITLDASFFIKAQRFWLKSPSMPTIPIRQWSTLESGFDFKIPHEFIPVIYGTPTITEDSDITHIGIDIFGSSFFMLSRYEEKIIRKLDKHSRFPACESVASVSNFLHRPIVNEYLEILWFFIKKNWPCIQRKEKIADNFITCDLDWPFDPGLKSFKIALVKSVYQLLNSQNIIESIFNCLRYLRAHLGFYVKDKYRENIDWIMSVNEAAGNKVAFYFITKNTSTLDNVEDFNSPQMRELVKSIHERGHEIGLHPGFNTYENPLHFEDSVQSFKKIINKANILQKLFGGRQHFLRWDPVITPALWDKFGFDYDSSLGYADEPGFRCGTCYEFSMYDLANRKSFNLKQRPLIVMESTIIERRYENLGYTDKALDRFLYFKRICHHYDGVFTLLWHNSEFNYKKDIEFYLMLIKKDF